MGGGNRENARAAMPWPPTAHSGIFEQLEYEITLTQGSAKHIFNETGITSFTASVNTGNWNVKVAVYYLDKLYAQGFNTVDVKPNQSNPVSILMERFINELPGTIEITTVSGNYFIGNELTAEYSESIDDITWQWHKDDADIDNANSSTYTPTAAGVYTVTISLEGYYPITSDPVNVTNVITRIEIDNPPDKTTYYTGEEIDYTGLVVIAVYTDNTEEPIAHEFLQFTGFNSNSAGFQTITVTYGTFDATLTVTVVQFIAVTDISGIPASMTRGVPLQLNGSVEPNNATNREPIVWTVSSAGATGATITDGTLNAPIAGNLTVTASIDNAATFNTAYTKNFNISVGNPFVTGITITTPPTKTVYFTGQTFDYSGIVVTANFNDGSTQDISSSLTASSFTGFNSSNPAALQTITVTYSGYTATFNISIQSVAITGIVVTTPPSKTKYFIGEAFDSSDIVVTANYNDGSSNPVGNQYLTFEGFNSSTLFNNLTITVKYNDFSAVFTVSIVEPVYRVSTLAGSTTSGFANATGTAAMFNSPTGIAVDNNGNIYVADAANHRIRKITPDGEVTTFAGSGTNGNEDATGTAARFSFPFGIAIDIEGNYFYVAEGSNRIRRITSDGVVTNFAGGGSATDTNGTGTMAAFSAPTGVTVHNNGNIYVTAQTHGRIRIITPAAVVTTLNNNAPFNYGGFEDSAVLTAQFFAPTGMAVDKDGNILVADTSNHRIRKIDLAAGVVTTIAGSASGNQDGTGTVARFNSPKGVAVDKDGNVYVTDRNNYRIRKITPDGEVTTIAGSGTSGFLDGTGTGVQFTSPDAIAMDKDGNIYVTDSHSIRKITIEYP
ncbi:MAG: bacterial Ig-like domain-containing protein [Treponema sp.]|nr:bacterial Ig-like domain-containing protein [Treponema sp.]